MKVELKRKTDQGNPINNKFPWFSDRQSMDPESECVGLVWQIWNPRVVSTVAFKTHLEESELIYLFEVQFYI